MKKKLLTIILPLLFMHVGVTTTYATSKITNSDGAYSNANIWTPVGVPSTEDTIIIQHDVTFTGQLIIDNAVSLFKIEATGNFTGTSGSDELVVNATKYENNGNVQVMHFADGNNEWYNNGTMVCDSVYEGHSSTYYNAGVLDARVFGYEGSFYNSGDLYSVYATTSDIFENQAGATIEVDSTMATSGDFTNLTGAQIDVLYGTLSMSGNFTNEADAIINIDIGSLVTSDNLVNDGDISCFAWTHGSGTATGTTGRFCISDCFVNNATITGTVDVCDNNTGQFCDINTGTIDNSVTNCQNGPCATSVGVASRAATNSLVEVYPNPFARHLTFHIGNRQPGTVTLYDATGKEVQQATFQGQYQLNTGHLPAGFYIYRVHGANGQLQSGKLVKH